jgi:hypothetical protein
MGHEAADAGHGPPGRHAEGEGIRVLREAQLAHPEEDDGGDDAAQQATEGGQTIPDLEDLERALVELLGVVEEQVH